MDAPWISEGPHAVGPMPNARPVCSCGTVPVQDLLPPAAQKTGEMEQPNKKPGFNSITIHQPQILKAFLELVKLVNPILFHIFKRSVKDFGLSQLGQKMALKA